MSKRDSSASVAAVDQDPCMQFITYQEYQIVLTPELVGMIKEYEDLVWASKFYKFSSLCMKSSRL